MQFARASKPCGSEQSEYRQRCQGVQVSDGLGSQRFSWRFSYSTSNLHRVALPCGLAGDSCSSRNASSGARDVEINSEFKLVGLGGLQCKLTEAERVRRPSRLVDDTCDACETRAAREGIGVPAGRNSQSIGRGVRGCKLVMVSAVSASSWRLRGRRARARTFERRAVRHVDACETRAVREGIKRPCGGTVEGSAELSGVQS